MKEVSIPSSGHSFRDRNLTVNRDLSIGDATLSSEKQTVIEVAAS